MRLVGACLLLILESAAVMAGEADATEAWRDKAVSDLRKAKEAYRKSLEKANEKLLTTFETQIEKVGNAKKLKVDNQVKLIEILRLERDVFKANNNRLPKSAPMLAAVQHYLMTMSVARRACEKEFDDAAELFLDKKDFAGAKTVLNDKAKYFTDLAGDDRVKWGHGHGNFIRREDGTWLESKTNGARYEFIETARTTDYVEITNPTGNYAIRIYDGHTAIRRGNGQYKVLFHGGWQK